MEIGESNKPFLLGRSQLWQSSTVTHTFRWDIFSLGPWKLIGQNAHCETMLARARVTPQSHGLYVGHGEQ
jgi:hypothetical protein